MHSHFNIANTNTFIKVAFLFLFILFDFSFSQNTVSKSFSISCPSQAVGWGFTSEPWAVECLWSFNASTHNVTVSTGSSYSPSCSRTFSVDSGLTAPVLSSRSAFHFSSLSGTYSANGVVNSCSCSATASQSILNGFGTVDCSSPANCNGTFLGTDFCSLSLDFQSPSSPPPPPNTVSKSFSISCPSQAVGWGFTGEPWAVECLWSFNASTHNVTVSTGSSYSPSCSRTFSVDSNLVSPVLSSRSASHSSNLSGTYGSPPIGCSCTATASLGLNSGSGSVSCSAPGSTICSGTFFGSDFCSLSLDFQPLPLPQCSDFLLISAPECKGGQGLYLTATGTAGDQIIGNNSNATIMSHPISHSPTNDTLTRPDGSKCVNNTQGELFNYTVCPFGFEAPPDSSSSCPAENLAPPALRKSIPEKKYEETPKKENSLQYVSKFYDALGRKTDPRSEVRRHLFTPKNVKSAARRKELGIEGFLRKDNLAGQCCVENFSVMFVDNGEIFIEDKVDVEVEFYAKFYGAEYSSECNVSCCEYKQEAKGTVFKNGEYKTNTTCKIDGDYVILDSIAYVPDCYGRDCIFHSDNRESYNDSLGTYKGKDIPGLKNVKAGDTLDIRMNFNSYIKDRCNAYEVRDSINWGFHMYGTAFGNLNIIQSGGRNQ